MVTQSDYVTLCDIYCRTVTQHLQIKYVVSRLILVWHWFAMRYRFTYGERGVKKKQKKKTQHPHRSCRCIWAHIDECVKLMYQAKPFAVMPSTGSHEQAVSGRQAAAAAAADMGLPILAKSFSSLIRSLKLTPPFQSISFFLFLSLSLCCGRPPSCRTTHTHTHIYTTHTHTHALLPPHCLFSLPLSFPISTMAASTSADGHYESEQPAAELSLALSILQ